MGTVTYANYNNPHITIHRDSCSQIEKRGGEHGPKSRGEYNSHANYSDAKQYAETTGLPARDCHFCKPHSD
jgi:hypothetical protein